MAALFKYFMGVAVILPAVMVLCAMTMSEIFVSIAAVPQAAATATSRWNTERLKAAPDTPYIAQGSLRPIYPATPGKELLGRPVNIGSTKRVNIRQALQLHKFIRPIYLADEKDINYRQQSLSYAEARPSQSLQPRILVIFGNRIY